MNKNYILDSFALIALLRHQPGGETVRKLLQESQDGKCKLWLSLINFGEIAYILERKRGQRGVREFITALDETTIELAAITRERVLAAAHIKAQHPLSYADAFAVALAQELQATVVTGDPEFHTVENLIDVLWL